MSTGPTALLERVREHLPERFRVTASGRETADTWTFALEPLAPEPFEFRPGQFTMLYAHGVGEVPISISGDPARPETLVHTVRAVGPVSRALCEVPVGGSIGVRGPFGRGWPVTEAEGGDLLVVAGGVGLAPLRSVVLTALADRGRYGRVIVLYGGRDPESLLFAGELDEWRAREDVELDVIVDAAGPEWRGSVGVVPALIERAGLDPATTTAMTCGPEVMMRFSVVALLDAGVPAERVFLSMERNMRCAIGHCGHCQWGAPFVCRDGPVFAWSEIEERFGVREL
jgi:NAD(P)H-flavin reductase